MPEEEPPECDMADFSFKQLVKVQLDPIPGTEANQRCHLLAVSNKYGLAFVGCANGFRVLRTEDLVVKGMERKRVGETIIDFAVWAKVDTTSPPCHLALSSDDLTLSVCVTRAAGVFALMFDIRAFATQSPSVAPFLEVRLSTTPEVRLADLMWNPGDNFASLFASCLSDGSVGLWQVMDSVTVTARLPTTVQATCLCWSPKGKQLVVGKTDGSLSQYDQQLKEKKRIPAPQTGASFSAVDVFWESTHVFVAAYAVVTEPDQPVLFTIQVPKGVSPIYRNYEDVCFGGGQERKLKYYLDVIPHWNMILAASSNALETAILGRSQLDANLWERWNLEDSSRSELPLTDNSDETYPTGVAIDFTSQTPIPFGENELYPAAPILLLLSTAGVLVAFHMIYTRPGIPQLTQPHTVLTSTGERKSNIPPSAVTAAPFQPPPAAMSSHGDVAEPKRMHVIGQSQALSFGAGAVATPVAAPAFGGGGGSLFGKAAPPSFGVATSQSLFGFKPLGGACITLGSGITSQKGQLPQPLFGSNQSNNQPNTSSNVDSSSLQPSDTSLSSLLGPASHAQDQEPQGVTSAPSQDSLGFGAQLPNVGGQLAGVKSADSSGSVAQPTLGRHTAAAVPKHAMTSVSAVLPRTDVSSSSDSVASASMTRSDTQAFGGAQSDGDVAHATPTLRHNTNSAENLLQSSIKEEMQHFQTELTDLRSRAATVRVDIGSKEEVQQLKRSTHEMVTFCDEIRLTTQGISEEIDELRTRCLDGYATFEECRMRDIRNQSADYKRLLCSRGLDPISDRHLKDIRMLDSTLRTKIRDVDANLDAEWEEYKRKKKVGRLLKTPATDNIYRTISNNQKVITSQRRTLTRLGGRTKDVYLNRGPQTPPVFVKPQLLHDLKDESIKKLTDKFMMTRLASISVVPAPVSPSKTSQLRQLLSSRSVTSVRTTTPRNLSMSQLVNSSALRDLQTCTQASQTMLDDDTMSQSSLAPAGQFGLSTGAGTTTDLPRSAARQNLLSQFGTANTLAVTSDRSASGIPEDAAKLPFSVPGRNGGLDLTTTANYESLAPKPGPAIKTLFGADASLPGVAAPSGFAATFGKSLNMDTPQPSLAIPSGFGATAGSSTPTETTQPSIAATGGLGTTFGTSQPTKSVQDDKGDETSEQPQKPAVFNFASASRALTFGSGPDDTAAESSKASFTFNSEATDPKPFKFATAGPSLFGGGIATGDTPSFFGSNLAGSSTGGAPSLFGAGLAAGSSTADTPSLLAGGLSASAISSVAQQKDESSAVPPKEKKLDAADVTDSETRNDEKTAREDDSREEPPRKSDTVKKSLLSEMLGAEKESPAVADAPTGDSVAKPRPVVASLPAAASTLSSLLESSVPATSEAVATTTSGDSQASASFFGGATFSFGAESKTDQPLFGASTTTTAKPIFGSAPVREADSSSESKADPPLFGAMTAKPIFGSTPVQDGGDSTSPSGTPTTADVAPSTLLAASKPSAVSTATTTPLFGAGATTAAPLFGGANVATTTPLFGNATASTTTASPLFGGGAITTTAPSFGNAVTATNATASPVSAGVTTTTPTALFGNTVTSTKAATPLFGGVTTTTTTPLFGGAPATTTTPAAPIFGGVTTTTTPLFEGAVTTTTTPAAPIFGGVTTTTTTPLFGGAVTTTTTTAAPIFGGVTTVAAPIFGGVTTTTTAPLFGNSTTTGPLFGGGSVASASPAFGSVTTTTVAGVFGGNTTTTASVFGGSSTGQTSGSMFGGQPSSGGTSLFGQPQQGAVFGQPNSVFGGQPATTAPLFGGQQTAPAFGTTATFGQTPPTSVVFGQPAAGGVFGQTSTPSSGGAFAGGGGGMFSGLGGKPSAENANKNVFGASQAFGGNQQAGSLFGGQAADKFNTAKTTAGFGSSSSFGGSGPTGSVMSSGFGFQLQPTATASPGGTSQPVFGGGGVFGGSPNFGAPSGFGSASFTSPFGGGIAPGSSPAPGMFGAAQGNDQATGGFAGFATNSQSPTFGSLAQNTTQQPTFGGSGFGDAGAGAPAFGGGSSFGFNSPSAAAPSFTAYRN